LIEEVRRGFKLEVRSGLMLEVLKGLRLEVSNGLILAVMIGFLLLAKAGLREVGIFKGCSPTRFGYPAISYLTIDDRFY
jgi:hypothetical protein